MTNAANSLFRDLIADYLGVPGVIGVQSGHGVTPDLLLFRGSHQQTLALPVALLFEESRESARQFVMEKMTASDGRFSNPALSPEEPAWKRVKEIYQVSP